MHCCSTWTSFFTQILVSDWQRHGRLDRVWSTLILTCKGQLLQIRFRMLNISKVIKLYRSQVYNPIQHSRKISLCDSESQAMIQSNSSKPLWFVWFRRVNSPLANRTPSRNVCKPWIYTCFLSRERKWATVRDQKINKFLWTNMEYVAAAKQTQRLRTLSSIW